MLRQGRKQVWMIALVVGFFGLACDSEQPGAQHDSTPEVDEDVLERLRAIA
jgi:hypothetical protein